MNGRIIKRNINETGGFIPLGRAGENKFRAIGIDVLGWADEATECRIIYSRPDGITYPAEITCQFDFLIWTPSAYDMEIPGEGQIEVRAYRGEKIGKSAIFKTKIEESMQAIETVAGIARPDWVDDIIDKVVISDMEQTEASTESGGKNIFTITLTNGESSSFEIRNGAQGEKGDTGVKGDKGDKGDKGADGYTPLRGVDYWTEDDKEETVTTVLEEAESSMDAKLGSYVKKADFSQAKGIRMTSSVSSTGTTYTPAIVKATTSEIKGFYGDYKPIVPSNLECAVDFANAKLGMASKAYVDNALGRYADWESVDGIIAERDEIISQIQTRLGDIDAAFNELHTYAQALIGGGA